MITIVYTSIDRVRKVRKFKTLAGARKFALDWVGPQDVVGGGYAVSDDGVGKVTWDGVTRRELFGGDTPTEQEIESAQDATWAAEMREQAEYEREWIIAEAEKLDRLSRPARDPRCTCSDYQLTQVGCDCDVSRK
jgi:hypothetical protein